jgi:mutator protein MutT
MKRRIAVRAIIVDADNKLFCVKLKAYGGKAQNQYWCLPGGGIDDGEALHAALQREMLEETGVAAQVGSLLYVQQFSFQGKEQLEFFFHVTNSADYQDIDLTAATHAEEEIAEFGFIDPRTTHLLPEFLGSEDIIKHIARTDPTQVFSYL